MLKCLIVGLGGALGAMLRYLIGLIPLKEAFVFPIKTFLINIAGCFVIGLVVALSIKLNNLNEKTILFLKAGLCGGFTTFSSFALESTDLIKSGHTGLAILYISLSILLGVFAVLVAQFLVK
ncbi:MAG: fluoride efflux transporter CrcB [Treponema sp.]|nr:fluoride efflux transporter CrcB [Treponema sp.]